MVVSTHFPSTTAERVDAIVFTAGIGENSCDLRQKICEGLSYMGVEMDAENRENSIPYIMMKLKGHPAKIAGNAQNRKNNNV